MRLLPVNGGACRAARCDNLAGFYLFQDRKTGVENYIYQLTLDCSNKELQAPAMKTAIACLLAMVLHMH